jgi:hypothetical protein
VDGSQADRRIHFRSVRLEWQANGEPVIGFRRVTKVESAYDGSIHLGYRQGPGAWRFETVEKNGNTGHYPFLLQRPNGEVDAIFHYDYDGMHLVRSWREGRTGSWRSWANGAADNHSVGDKTRKAWFILVFFRGVLMAIATSPIMHVGPEIN